MSENTQIQKINEEINHELADAKVGAALLATTFKGLNPTSMKQAIMEGMIRGYSFKDFLQKDVYAVPFGEGYSIVEAISRARKIGAKSGVIGKTKPTYVHDEKGKIETCAITVYKRGGHPDGFTAEVYFDEYVSGKPIWKQKPHTMIAKVAEMHALRMACPEELAQSYIEEEFDQEEKVERIKGVETLLGEGDLKMGNFLKDEKNSGEKKGKEGEEDPKDGAAAGGAKEAS